MGHLIGENIKTVSLNGQFNYDLYLTPDSSMAERMCKTIISSIILSMQCTTFNTAIVKS